MWSASSTVFLLSGGSGRCGGVSAPGGRCACGWDRTSGLRIKSPQLYQLSYAGGYLCPRRALPHRRALPLLVVWSCRTGWVIAI